MWVMTTSIRLMWNYLSLNLPQHKGILGLRSPRSANLPSRLGLARADFLQGAYQDFLALWKDADPDIPILKQAKAEYANLQ